MSRRHRLSLATAILTNINIMAGAGIFINMVLLTQLTRIAGSFAYLFIGLFMLPLIKSIASLVKKYPEGGFYAYAAPVSPLLGFISCWTYFFSKLASTSLVLYVSAVFLKQLFPNLLNLIGTLPLSITILAIFTYLNLFNVAIGSSIQKLFFSAKAIPVLFIILLGIVNLSPATLSISGADFTYLPTVIPLALYCLAGFEAACALSRNIINPQVNGPRAIFYSFFIIVGTYTVFQLLTSMMLVSSINQISSYQDAFPYLANLVTKTPWLAQRIANTINIFIVVSTLGGAYSMLFANPWNLYTLAEHGHLPNSEKMTKLNQHEIPTGTIIAESTICLGYLLLTNGNQLPLQQTAALGATIAYTITILSILIKQPKKSIIPWLALITCSGFIISCIISTLRHSISSLLLFISMLTFGLIMFWMSKKK